MKHFYYVRLRMLWLLIPAFFKQWLREKMENISFVARYIVIWMCSCLLMAERVIALPTCALCQAALLVLGCKNTTVTYKVLCSPFLIMTSIWWFSLQKKMAHIYSFMFIWVFFQKEIELVKYIVRKYNKPPECSNLTGVLEGGSSDCLMKMNGENCW